MSHPQKVWKWPIALETFLASTGAGAYMMTTVADLLGFANQSAVIVPSTVSSLLLIGISAIILVADLGNMMHVRYVFSNIKSPITIGTIAITAFSLTAVITLGMALDILKVAAQIRQGVEVLGSIFALVVLLYPGLLLGVLKNIPFYNSPILPLLFLSSGLVTGTALVQVLLSFSSLGTVSLILFLTSVNIAVLGVFGLSLLLQLVVKGNSVSAAVDSVKLLTRSKFTMPFWLGVVLLGVVVPLTLFCATLLGLATLISIADICALIGGATIRLLIISVGIPTPIPVATGAINLKLV